MYRKIMVGHDLHSGGRDALALAREIAEGTGTQLLIAGVYPTCTPPCGYEAEWAEEEGRHAVALQDIADEVGAEAETFASNSPAAGLYALAEATDSDLVVVGSSQHSKLGRILAGSVALSLLHGAPCAVALAPRGYAEQSHDGLSTIAVGVDGSHESRLAVDDAAELAESSGAKIQLVAVAQEPVVAHGKGAGMGGYQALQDAVEEQRQGQLSEALDSLPEGLSAQGSVILGDPTERLAQAGAESSLLILGSRAYGPLRRVLLGSVSTALMRTASFPVLIHPRGVESGSRTPESADAMTVA